MTVLIIIAVVAVLVFWVISVQRKLVGKEELCKNAMSQIGVQQSSCWDALTALIELVKSYNEHEYNSLRDIIAARRDITASSSTQEAEAQEQAIAGALQKLNFVVERYPALKANENYAKAMDAVNTYENQVRTARMVYNDTVTNFNRLVRQLPDSLIAGLLGFTEKEYLKVEEGKTSMPSMKI